MENATKALLIAAAVLIAILIISLGLVVYNRASETVNTAGDLSEYQIQQQNEKFKKYEGTSVSGSDVNAMLQTVFNHNMAQADSSTCVAVEASTDNTGSLPTGFGISTTTTMSKSPAKVSTGARYTVKCEYSTSTKLINKITVKVN